MSMECNRFSNKMKEKETTSWTRAVPIPDQVMVALNSGGSLVVEGEGRVVNATQLPIFAPEPRFKFSDSFFTKYR